MIPSTLGYAERLAERLAEAERTREGIERPSAGNPELTVEDAYRVQEIGIARRINNGELMVGRKIGLTSAAMQQQLGVDEPDFGVITDAMVISNGGSIDAATLLVPKLEPEYAFRIDGELPVLPSYDEVRAAIGAVALAIEIIDSRVLDWNIGLVDTIADNASSARVVVGDWREASPELLDAIVEQEIELLHSEEVVASGPGAAVLGDPVAAVHWLATAIGAFDQRLETGSIILAGSVTAAAALRSGDRWACRSEGFDTVKVVVK